uniref:Major facilitator superfamily (MFS) profile domain-containing protein n=1 Tax=Vitis vinifera TaxID=29760 RepID=F6HK76_VITVI
MMMKQRDLKKIPGCSQIELEGNVHKFFVRDKSHPQVREIYSMLDSLSTLNSEDYTEICQRLSEDRILDLFQWKYAHSLVVGVSAAGMCLSCLIIGISFLLQDLHKWKELTPIMVLIGMVAYLAWYSLGFRGLPWVIISEIYPVNIKGSAGSLVTFILWSSSTIVVYVFNFIFEWNSAGTFFIFSVFSAATVLFTIKLVPETKGRTLEEIQASMTHFLQH